MKKITKLLVVGLLSMVMVFSAAACSATPTDVTGIDESLTEISTILDLLKAQQGGTNDAIAAVEAAVKAGNTKDALTALSAEIKNLVTAANAEATTANLQAQEAAFVSYLNVLEAAAIAKTPAPASPVAGKSTFGVHNLYLGTASLNVAVTGGKLVVSDVVLDEYFTPGTYAKVHNPAASTVAGSAGHATDGWGWKKAWTTAGGTEATFTTWLESADLISTVAKYIQVGGVVFEHNGVHSATTSNPGIVNGFGGNKVKAGEVIYKQVSAGTVAGLKGPITNLAQEIIKNPAVGAWYRDTVADGTGFKVLKTDSEGTITFTSGTSTVKLSETGITAANYNNKARKSDGIYWNVSSYPLGWVGNMAALETFLETGDNISCSPLDIYSVNGTFMLGGVISTGSTASDVRDYVRLAQLAYIDALLTIINLPISA